MFSIRSGDEVNEESTEVPLAGQPGDAEVGSEPPVQQPADGPVVAAVDPEPSVLEPQIRCPAEGLEFEF